MVYTMKYIIFTVLLFACTPEQIHFLEEAGEGELNIIENLVDEELGIPIPKPKVNIVSIKV